MVHTSINSENNRTNNSNRNRNRNNNNNNNSNRDCARLPTSSRPLPKKVSTNSSMYDIFLSNIYIYMYIYIYTYMYTAQPGYEKNIELDLYKNIMCIYIYIYTYTYTYAQSITKNHSLDAQTHSLNNNSLNSH